jgi:hypothetical protein
VYLYSPFNLLAASKGFDNPQGLCNLGGLVLGKKLKIDIQRTPPKQVPSLAMPEKSLSMAFAAIPALFCFVTAEP